MCQVGPFGPSSLASLSQQLVGLWSCRSSVVVEYWSNGVGLNCVKMVLFTDVFFLNFNKYLFVVKLQFKISPFQINMTKFGQIAYNKYICEFNQSLTYMNRNMNFKRLFIELEKTMSFLGWVFIMLVLCLH